MTIRMLASLSLCILIACGGSDTQTATGAQPSTSGDEAVTQIPSDAWLVVRASDGRAIPVGSGVRLHAEAFDVVSRDQGNTFPMTCTIADAWTCEAMGAPMQIAIVEGAVRITQPGLVLLLAPADAASAATFTATLAAGEAQRTACRRAADCCVALENAGETCDLAAVLGDRSRAACDAGFETLRARVAQGDPPDACR